MVSSFLVFIEGTYGVIVLEDLVQDLFRGCDAIQAFPNYSFASRVSIALLEFLKLDSGLGC